MSGLKTVAHLIMLTSGTATLAYRVILLLVSVTVLRPFRLWDLYGAPGIILYLFGSRTTWNVEAQVLGRQDEDDAMQFKKSVQDECTMVSVAVCTTPCGIIIVKNPC